MSSWTAKAQPQTPTAQTNSTPFSWPNASLGNRATLVPLKGPPPVPHYLSAICPRNDSRSGPYNYPEPLDADPALQGFPAVCPVVAAREGLQGRRAGGRLWARGRGAGSVPHQCGGGRGIHSGAVSRGGSPRRWPGRRAGLPRVCHRTGNSPPRLSEPQCSHL